MKNLRWKNWVEVILYGKGIICMYNFKRCCDLHLNENVKVKSRYFSFFGISLCYEKREKTIYFLKVESCDRNTSCQGPAKKHEKMKDIKSSRKGFENLKVRIAVCEIGRRLPLLSCHCILFGPKEQEREKNRVKHFLNNIKWLKTGAQSVCMVGSTENGPRRVPRYMFFQQLVNISLRIRSFDICWSALTFIYLSLYQLCRFDCIFKIVNIPFFFHLFELCCVYCALHSVLLLHGVSVYWIQKTSLNQRHQCTT